MAAEILAITKDIERNEWLELRKQGIGGSDVSAIAGLNKWRSPIQVYMDKLGELEETEMNEKMYWGTRLEDLVADEFSKRTGLKVRRRNAILRHPEYQFMLANLDRMIVGKNELLECKTAGEYAKGEWEGEDVPAPYLLQIQHYMAVTGADACWIAVLIGGSNFIYKRIERDEELIQYLIDIEKNFWENHVLKRIPPELDGSEASSELLKQLHPISEPNSEIELPSEADSMIVAIKQLKSDIDELTLQKDSYENQLKAMIGDFETGIASEHIVTWKSIISNRIDPENLKKDHPDIYFKYTKPSISRRFQIK